MRNNFICIKYCLEFVYCIFVFSIYWKSTSMNPLCFPPLFFTRFQTLFIDKSNKDLCFIVLNAAAIFIFHSVIWWNRVVHIFWMNIFWNIYFSLQGIPLSVSDQQQQYCGNERERERRSVYKKKQGPLSLFFSLDLNLTYGLRKVW